MTAQISDRFTYKDDEYSIVAMSSQLQFSPSKYGIRPDAVCTACWNGYWCEYVIAPDGIVLKNLYINSHDGNYPPINNVEAVCEDDYLLGHHLYRDVNIKIPYTGKILVGKDFLRDYYIHMGYQRAWAYKTLTELVFENGQLVEENDHSEIAAKLREKYDNEDFRNIDFDDIPRFVEESFSLDMSVKAWWIK